MTRKNINFEAKKINKNKFYKSKKLFKIEDIDVYNTLVSKKEPYGEKSFRHLVGYNDDDDVIRSLWIRLSEMIGYVKHFKNNNDNVSKGMSFNVSDKKPLKKYTKILEKIGNLLNKESESEPVYGNNDKYIWAKIKQNKEKTNTNFQGKKVSKENESFKCLSLIMLESVIKTTKKHYPQALLEKCIYETKKKTVENLINDDFDPCSSDRSKLKDQPKQ